MELFFGQNAEQNNIENAKLRFMYFIIQILQVFNNFSRNSSNNSIVWHIFGYN